ncbi:hypothetical protein ABS71_17875 [bacterium SCN 62-11]|nr:MAG: hypothetical protein ABS71_17875 [bacterium SCN 62-11]
MQPGHARARFRQVEVFSLEISGREFPEDEFAAALRLQIVQCGKTDAHLHDRALQQDFQDIVLGRSGLHGNEVFQEELPGLLVIVSL